MCRLASILCRCSLLAGLSTGHVVADEPDIFSPVVSYQFQEALETTEGIFINSPVVSFQFQESLEMAENLAVQSPVVSFQYLEWPGDENLAVENSPAVSYFFSGGMSLALSGLVSSTDGLPIPGAVVTLKRYGTAFWTGTTSSTGTFTLSNLQAAKLTATVSKPGFVTLIRNIDGEAGGSQNLEFRLTPATVPPETMAVSRVATGEEAGVARTSGTSLLAIFDVGTNNFIPVADGVIPQNRPTVILAHGWKSSPDDWALALARLINNHPKPGTVTPNILVWDWRGDAATATPPTDLACTQGVEMGKALHAKLGTAYSQHVHFIGHSLGALVNAYACNYAHAGLERGNTNPQEHWDAALTTPQVTLLDEAEVATVFGQKVTQSASLAWHLAGIKGAVVAGTGAAIRDWKNPVPTNALWVDNYISLVGIQRDDAVNVCLWKKALTIDWHNPEAGLTSAHAFAHLFYRNTVAPTGAAPPVGYGRSVEGGGNIPPSGTGLTHGSLWYENDLTADPLDMQLQPNPEPFEANKLMAGLLVVPLAATMNADAKAVGRDIAADIKWVCNIPGSVVRTTGQVFSSAKEKIGFWMDAAWDKGSDILNNIDPESQLAAPMSASVMSFSLQTQPVPSNNRMPRSGGGSAGQPACAWMTVQVPPDAGLMAFDFTVTGDPVEDSIACAVNGQNVFALQAKFAPDGSPVSTDMIDVSAFAGQTVELFFGLVGGTSTNCTAAIDGIRFITIPQPAVKVDVVGQDARVSWPAAAMGWVLESSDTLAPESWQAVPPDGVVVVDGIASIIEPRSDQKRFYRLRREN
jgi:hypothetical protein